MELIGVLHNCNSHLNWGSSVLSVKDTLGYLNCHCCRKVGPIGELASKGDKPGKYQIEGSMENILLCSCWI